MYEGNFTKNPEFLYEEYEMFDLEEVVMISDCPFVNLNTCWILF